MIHQVLFVVLMISKQLLALKTSWVKMINYGLGADQNDLGQEFILYHNEDPWCSIDR